MLQRKLGKLPKRTDKRTLKLSNYLGTFLPTPPKNDSWLTKVSNWPMMGNDTVGDCTCAGVGHAEQLFTTYAQDIPFVATTAQVLAFYSAITGYNPNDPSTDQGAACLDVLNYWKNTGMCGHKISAYMQAAEKPIPPNQLADTIWLFGCAYIGIQLPVAVQNTHTWDVPVGQKLVGEWEPGSWGGHCVIIPSYDITKSMGLNVISWGEVIPMSWNFFNAYCEEAYTVLSPDWIEKSGVNPDNFNLAQLQEDLKVL